MRYYNKFGHGLRISKDIVERAQAGKFLGQVITGGDSMLYL